MSVIGESIQNITASQKELLLWHWRMHHLGFCHLQMLMRDRTQNPSFSSSLKKSVPSTAISFFQSIIQSDIQASRCDPPLCATCQFAKARRRSANDNLKSTGEKLSLCSNQLTQGSYISVDHYKSPVRGRISASKGRETFGNKYVGGTTSMIILVVIYNVFINPLLERPIPSF
jgi:hypothetical protein